MASNTFQLSQTTTQIQSLLNLLIANTYSEGYILISAGAGGGIKFMQPLRSGDQYIQVNGSTITLNKNNLFEDFILPDNVEINTNKKTEIQAGAAVGDYPTSLAVINYIRDNTAIKDMAAITGYDTKAKILEAFQKNQLASGKLYTTLITESGRIYPCIFMQSGNKTTQGAKITLMLLYGHTWCEVTGTVSGSNITVTSSDNIAYDLSTVATKTWVNDLIFGSLDKEY